MKRTAIRTNMQFNLPLPNAPAAVLPCNKQRELELALVELLLSAAHENADGLAQGGESEPKADD